MLRSFVCLVAFGLLACTSNAVAVGQCKVEVWTNCTTELSLPGCPILTECDISPIFGPVCPTLKAMDEFSNPFRGVRDAVVGETGKTNWGQDVEVPCSKEYWCDCTPIGFDLATGQTIYGCVKDLPTGVTGNPYSDLVTFGDPCPGVVVIDPPDPIEIGL